MKYSKDVFYTFALCLIVVAGCRTPLGNFNKQKEVVDNIQKQEDANQQELIESGRTFGSAGAQA